MVAAAAVVLAGVASGCGRGAGHAAPPPVPSSGSALPGGTPAAAAPVTSAPGTSATTAVPAPTTSSVDPGLLPQLQVLPAQDDPVFAAHAEALWRAIVADDPSLALAFFFPRTAYLQLKAVANASADYRDRLVAFFDLDVHAAHALLGAGGATATLVGVDVPTSQAVWVLPGQEQNRLPYYRVYGTRLTYRVNGVEKSFGIFSLLSWRGQWYVIHLGPNPRPASRGFVYQPAG